MARSLLLLFVVLVFGCNNLEDANIPERQTFIRFFGSSNSYTAVAAEQTADGGYIIAGNVVPAGSDNPGIIIIKTNEQGGEEWEKIIPDGNAKSIQQIGTDYLLTGEGITLNASASDVSEIINTKFRLLRLDAQGAILKEYTKDSTITTTRGEQSVTLNVDFHAAATIQLSSNEIATLGSFKVPGSQERIITVGFNPTTLNVLWRKNLDLLNSDYLNVNSLKLSQGNLLWAATAAPINQSESKYVSVITAPPNYASPANNSLFGKDDATGSHIVNDIQSSGTGFALIGTITLKSGASNIYFARVDPAGNIMAASERYFDGVGTDGVLVLKDKTAEGKSLDAGRALTFTRDGGYILACTMGENIDRGNGGNDILLIKIDAFGDYMWDKVLGGGGDEVVNSIRELPDGNLLICGTETISNVSSIFIIRADRDGNLKD